MFNLPFLDFGFLDILPGAEDIFFRGTLFLAPPSGDNWRRGIGKYCSTPRLKGLFLLLTSAISVREGDEDEEVFSCFLRDLRPPGIDDLSYSFLGASLTALPLGELPEHPPLCKTSGDGHRSNSGLKLRRSSNEEFSELELLLRLDQRLSYLGKPENMDDCRYNISPRDGNILWLIYTAGCGFGFGTPNPMATWHYAEVFTLHRVRFRFQS